MEPRPLAEAPRSPVFTRARVALERVKASVQQGREQAAQKVRGARLATTGVAVGAALLLAACGSEAAPPAPVAAPTIQPPAVSEMFTPPSSPTAILTPEASPTAPPLPTAQPTREALPTSAPTAEPSPTAAPRIEHRTFPAKRADGTREFSLPLRAEEKKLLEEDVVIMVTVVRDLLKDDYLKSHGVDLDQIAANLKKLDEKELLRWSGRSNTDRREDNQEQGWLPLPGTTISIGFAKDVVSGELVHKSVSFTVDGNVEFANPFDVPAGEADEAAAQDGMRKLPRKLDKSVKPPRSHKPGFSFSKLAYQQYLWTAEGDPDGKLKPEHYMQSREYVENDGGGFTLGIGVNGIDRYQVIVTANARDRGFIGRGKGPDQP